MPLIKSANEFNERIKVYETKPSSGFFPGEDEEILLFTCWAKIMISTLQDVKQYSGTGMEDVLEIVIRHQQKKKVTNKMVIEWQNKKYSIKKINVDNARKEFDVVFVKLSG